MVNIGNAPVPKVPRHCHFWNLRFVQSERWPFVQSKLMTPTQIAKSSSGASVKLKRQTNCKSANVIYLITCIQCGKQYVGETKRALNERMNGHRSDWTKRRFQRSPVTEHFHLQNHDFNSHVSLCCIDHDAQWSDDTRKARESYWIRRLNTIQPHGINKGD